MTPSRRTIGLKLRELRQARGLTQVELSGRLGISQASLSQVEAGRRSLSAEQFVLVLKLFNVGASDFTDESPDPSAQLQNALARLGASHLQEAEDVVPEKRLEAVSEVVHDALVSGTPRLITALAPVLVLHIDEFNLNAVRAKLAPVGLQARLDWLVDNTNHAVHEELRDELPRAWSRRYRRAQVVLEAALEFTSHQQQAATPENPRDILDEHIRTKTTLREVWASSSPISRRWGIATTLQPQDFANALRAARDEP